MPSYQVENPSLPQVVGLKNYEGKPMLGYSASLNDVLYQLAVNNSQSSNDSYLISLFLQGANGAFGQYKCTSNEVQFDTFYQGFGAPARKSALIHIYEPTNGHTTTAHLKAYGVAGTFNYTGYEYPFQPVQMQVKNLHTGNYVEQMPLNQAGLFLVELNQLFSLLTLAYEENSEDLSFGVSLT